MSTNARPEVPGGVANGIIDTRGSGGALVDERLGVEVIIWDRSKESSTELKVTLLITRSAMLFSHLLLIACRRKTLFFKKLQNCLLPCLQLVFGAELCGGPGNGGGII